MEKKQVKSNIFMPLTQILMKNNNCLILQLSVFFFLNEMAQNHVIKFHHKHINMIYFMHNELQFVFISQLANMICRKKLLR